MPQSIVDQVLVLRTRILGTGYGSIRIPSTQPIAPDVVVGEITIRPNPLERDDLLAFLRRLINEHGYDRRFDTLVLSYEGGWLTHARISFTARPC